MGNMDSNWVWLPDWTIEDDTKPQIVLFRKKVTFEKKPETYVVDVTADARYKLYVNGTFIQEGPQKPTKEKWYVDTADLAPHFHEGEIVVAAEVLRYPAKRGLHNELLHRTAFP